MPSIGWCRLSSRSRPSKAKSKRAWRAVAGRRTYLRQHVRWAAGETQDDADASVLAAIAGS
jgi:hypothetical protein